MFETSVCLRASIVCLMFVMYDDRIFLLKVKQVKYSFTE